MSGEPPRIPVNLITGFLGVGKTTAVTHLLQNHPAGERWAVLVNEFGEIGVDGVLLERPDIVVEEVAGGCLCCVAAPAFTTGLNQLIRRQRPDRILIEPSGLGHPARVLETLTGPLYRSVLDVRCMVCLVDARHLSSPRHREHPNFVDQIHLADIIVGNKSDLYSAGDRAAFEDFVAELRPAKDKIGLTRDGRFDIRWLTLPRGSGRLAAFPEAHAFLAAAPHAHDQRAEPTASDWLVIEGQSDGYHRCGWLMRPGRACKLGELEIAMEGVIAERKKGVFRSDRGWFAYNQGDWTTTAAPRDGRSRLEVIDPDPIDVAGIDRRLRGLATRSPA